MLVSRMYAGLLVIRKYQESIGKIHGNVCIILKSAHSMNPDTAMTPHISMKINWIDDFQGVAVRGTQEDQAGDRR